MLSRVWNLLVPASYTMKDATLDSGRPRSICLGTQLLACSSWKRTLVGLRAAHCRSHRPGFQVLESIAKTRKAPPSCLCCLTEDTRRRQRRWHVLAPRCTWSGRLEKPSLLKLLVSALSRVQWKLLTWLLNDGWQLGVWLLTRTKH